MADKNPCPVCGSTEFYEFTRDSRDNIPLLLRKCRNCSHLFQDKVEFDDIYTDSAFSILARGNSDTPDSLKIKQLDQKAFDRYEFYFDLLKEGSTALDIGSSIGSFVHILKLSGKNAAGIEPDRAYAAFSKQQYFFKQEASLFEDFKTTQKFDLITSFHVIEHVHDPDGFVQKCSSLLNEGGRILLECPSWEIRNYGRRKEAIWAPHIHYFSLKTMYRLLNRYFEVDSYGIYGSALFMSGVKKSGHTFDHNPYLRLRILSAYANFLRIIFPPVVRKGSSPDILRQLLIQVLVNKNKFKYTLTKAWKYGIYRIREYSYLKREKGKGKRDITHITNYKGWGNNSGDVVLSKSVRDTLNFKEKNRYTIIALKEKIDSRLIKQVNSSDLLLIGGGGLFLPDTNINSVSGWQWAISKELLKQINKPIILYAIGYNYFRGQEPNSLFLDNLDLILAKAQFIGIRNHGSINTLNQLTDGKYREKIRYQPCPTTFISKLWPKYQYDGRERKKVAVNIAFDRYHIRFGKDIYTILDEIGSALKRIEDMGYEIINTSHISADEKFRIILDRYGINYRTIRLQHKFPLQVYRFYSKVDLVIGMRGHAQMVPFGLGTPIISLGTHDKMKWFLEDVKSADWYIDLNKDSKDLSGTIFDKFLSIIQNRSEVLDRISEQKESIYQISMENLEEIAKYLHPEKGIFRN